MGGGIRSVYRETRACNAQGGFPQTLGNFGEDWQRIGFRKKGIDGLACKQSEHCRGVAISAEIERGGGHSSILKFTERLFLDKEKSLTPTIDFMQASQ